MRSVRGGGCGTGFASGVWDGAAGGGNKEAGLYTLRHTHVHTAHALRHTHAHTQHIIHAIFAVFCASHTHLCHTHAHAQLRQYKVQCALRALAFWAKRTLAAGWQGWREVVAWRARMRANASRIIAKIRNRGLRVRGAACAVEGLMSAWLEWFVGCGRRGGGGVGGLRSATGLRPCAGLRVYGVGGG